MNHCNFYLSLSLEELLAKCGSADIFLLLNEYAQRTLLISVLGDSSELIEPVLRSVKMVSIHYLYT